MWYMVTLLLREARPAWMLALPPFVRGDDNPPLCSGSAPRSRPGRGEAHPPFHGGSCREGHLFSPLPLHPPPPRTFPLANLLSEKATAPSITTTEAQRPKSSEA
jgi:hypothetical protein